MCKYWAHRDEGCLRGDTCQYLHSNIREYQEKSKSMSDCISTNDSQNKSEEKNEDECFNSQEKPTNEFKNKIEVDLEELEYWANKKPASQQMREFSMEDLERWSNIGRNKRAEEVECYNKGEQRKCQFCKYTCIKRITMLKHVNSKHGHGHGE